MKSTTYLLLTLISLFILSTTTIASIPTETGIYAAKRVNGDAEYKIPYAIFELGGQTFRIADNYIAPRSSIFTLDHYGLSLEWLNEMPLPFGHLQFNTGTLYNWDKQAFTDWITGVNFHIHTQ